jgi:hypothetical protein
MKTLTAISAIALLSFAAPAFAQSAYDTQNGVQQRTAPGGMNNSVSPGDQRGLSQDGGYGLREGRASSRDDTTYRNGAVIDNRNAPGGMNNGDSPALQH